MSAPHNVGMPAPQPPLSPEAKVRFPGPKVWIIGLVLALALPAVGEVLYYQRISRDVCTLDAIPIQPIYRTTLSFGSGRKLQFGSPRCALTYLRKHPNVERVEVTVTDEVTGRPLPSEKAFFVKSAVETSAQDHNHIHVFVDEVEARRHAMLYEGKLLDDPFAPYLERTGQPRSSAGKVRPSAQTPPATGSEVAP